MALRKLLTVRVDDDFLEELAEVAAWMQRSRSDVIRFVVRSTFEGCSDQKKEVVSESHSQRQ